MRRVLDEALPSGRTGARASRAPGKRLMSPALAKADKYGGRCPRCAQRLTFVAHAVITGTAPSVRQGTDPHDGTDRFQYQDAWVCDNPHCDYRKSVNTQ